MANVWESWGKQHKTEFCADKYNHKSLSLLLNFLKKIGRNILTKLMINVDMLFFTARLFGFIFVYFTPILIKT